MFMSIKPTPNVTQKTTQDAETPAKYNTMPNTIRAKAPLNTIFTSQYYSTHQPRLNLTSMAQKYRRFLPFLCISSGGNPMGVATGAGVANLPMPALLL